jgi:steroid 5-alpha reductase family enzyme
MVALFDIGGETVLFGLATAVAMMGIVTVVSNRIKNAGFVDVMWGVTLTILPFIYSWLSYGYWGRELLIGGTLALASGRLALHLWRRFLLEHPKEDPRYNNLRKAWQARGFSDDWIEFFFFWVFQIQAVLIAVLSFPMAIAMQNANPQIMWPEWLGLGIWIIGFIGETVADEQLRDFKRWPSNDKKVCQSGLWKYSRHPNYFCQWLMWVAYWVIASATVSGIYTVFVPIIMLIFLTKYTGVAATEAHALESRGSAYLAYQKSTSPFIPWFPKKTK